MLGTPLRKHPFAIRRFRIGEPNPWDIFDERGILLLKKGVLIQNGPQITELAERGILTPEILASIGPEIVRARAPAGPIRAGSPFAVWEDIQLHLGDLIRRSIYDPQGTFPYDISVLAALIGHQTAENTDVACFFVAQVEVERYPIAHMLHTAIICAAISRRLEWDGAKRLSAICAALTMNVAMLDLQERLTVANFPLLPEDIAAIRGHPEAGAVILRRAGVTDEAWLRAVREHHENHAGTGYPVGVAPFDVADLVGRADLLAAKVSPRRYRNGLSPHRALRELFLQTGDVGDVIPSAMVREFGVYPPGTYVQLANDEIGVVILRGEKGNEPIVVSLFDSAGFPHTTPVRRDTAQSPYRIRNNIAPGAVKSWLNRDALYRIRV